MIVKRTHFIKEASKNRFPGQTQNIFHKVVELDNGVYLLEAWKKGAVSYIPYCEEQFQKMNNGGFSGVL